MAELSEPSAAPSAAAAQSGLKVVGLIPARAGSKGIPRKNLRLLGGLPLVQHTLAAAMGAGRLDRVVLSTDDPEVMELGRGLGVEVPFRRPPELATDTATSLAVVVHALHWFQEEEGYRPDAVALLQPTNPLRDAADIDRCVDVFLGVMPGCLLSVSPVVQHPCEIVRERPGGGFEYAVPRPQGAMRRQDFPEYHFIDGAVTLSSVSFIECANCLFDESASIVPLPEGHGIDIDEEMDLAIAEAWLRRLRSLD